MLVHNVRDGRRGFIGSWVVEPLSYDALSAADIGRTVIYQPRGRWSKMVEAEAGTLSSFRDGLVFAKYSRGDTAAGATAANVCFGIKPLDTPEEILAASSQE